MVTLAEVARLAGVSEATASRALSSSRPVGRDVEVRVKQAAAQLGYVGNSIARALRRHRTDTVGMVVPSILNPFFTTLVDSMERALHAEGKQLFLCDSRHDAEVEAEQLRSLIQRQVDGIVVSACDQEASVPALRAASLSVPLVQLDRRVDVEGTDWIGVDDDEAMRLVLEHLAATGVRSAAFVTSALTNSSTQLRLDGFHRHAARLGLEVRDEWIVLDSFSIDSGQAAARALFGDRSVGGGRVGGGRDDAAARPQAVVCGDDLIAIGVLRGCRELGVRVPVDVQVTGFDDITFAEFVVPSLTSLSQPTDRMATEALRLLDLAAATPGDPARSATRTAFAPTLVLRETTR